MLFSLLTLGIGRMKGGGELITDQTVTFSSPRHSHRQRKTHK